MKRLLLRPLPPILPSSLRPSPTIIISSRHQSSSSSSSSPWMRRHLKDPYVKASKKQDLRSRAAFKLKEMQEKHHILKRGDCVIDLGCAPGGWSEVAAQLVLPPPAAAAASPPSTQTAPPNETVKTGRVIGIDRLPMLPIQGVTFLQGDFTEATTKEALLQALFPSPSAAIEEERKERIRVDVILSDMSPDFMGDAFTDHRRCLDLCYEVMDFADEVFGAPPTTTTSTTTRKKGKATILLKFFKGRDEGLFLSDLRVRYKEVKLLKPKASRKESAEQYVLARGWQRWGKEEEDE